MAGAYKATATEALEAELDVKPLDLHTGRTALVAAARNMLASTNAGIQGRIQTITRRPHRQPRRGRGRAEPPANTIP